MDDKQLPKVDDRRPRLRIDVSDLPPDAGPAPAAPLPPVERNTLWSGPVVPAAPAPVPTAPTTVKPAVLGAMACHNCGGVLDPRAVACPRCGLPTPTAYAGQAAAAVIGVNRKSAGVALLLSLLWPGAGQIYVGRTGPGAAFMVSSFIAVLLMLVLIGLLIYPVLLIWAMIDAYNAAESHNARLLSGRYP